MVWIKITNFIILGILGSLNIQGSYRASKHLISEHLISVMMRHIGPQRLWFIIYTDSDASTPSPRRRFTATYKMP